MFNKTTQCADQHNFKGYHGTIQDSTAYNDSLHEGQLVYLPLTED